MINAETIAKMKDGVKIINLARAELVDSAAMIEAVNSGKVSAYVTDFITDDLIGVSDKIVCIPHLGASTEESEDKCAIMAAKELIEYLEKGNIKNSVNFPNVELPHSGDERICIMHRNTPGVIKNISTAIAEENINIENMVNRSRGNYAYTIIDTNTHVSQHTVDAMKALDGVVRVRVIH
jgi:D-3-phosphoglycerate dehydrogenase